MTPQWILLTTDDGTRRHLQVRHITCFRPTAGGSLVYVRGYQVPWTVVETEDEIKRMLGIVYYT